MFDTLEILSEDIIDIVSCVLCLNLCLYGAEQCLKSILQNFNYTNIHEDQLPKGHYTGQVLYLSSIITIILVYYGFDQYIVLSSNASCSEIRDYDINEHFFTMLLFIAYLVHDMIFHKLPLQSIVHHIFCCVSVTAILISRSKYGMYFATASMLVELSTPALNLIYLTKGTLNTISLILFGITFTIVRPIYMLLIILKMVQCGLEFNVEIFGFIIFIALYILNLYWFVLLIRKMYRKLFNHKNLDYTLNDD